VPKVEEFHHLNIKDGATRGAHAAQALALRERLHCASDTITLAQTLITDLMGTRNLAPKTESIT
jgi:hypothetical protein